MKTSKVHLAAKTGSYDIFIGKNIARELPAQLKTLKIAESIFLISDPKVFGLHGNRLLSALKNAGISNIGTALFGRGEENKSWKNYEKLINNLIDFDFGKKNKITVMALGGGVVGDMAGFIASVYRRGLPFVQVPTTLLSAVDSSIGGKTGIDYERNGKVIKNILGHFYQPRLVCMDTEFLKTLEDKEIKNGLSEIIKYGIIKNSALFYYLKRNLSKALKKDSEILTYLIRESCKIKRNVVQLDEKETKNIRTILNFGHTIGHAIEGASNFRVSHGQAVAIGMICETYMANEMGLIDKASCKEIESVIENTGLPVKTSACGIKDVMHIMKYDKKFQSGKNKFVLPVKIGKVCVKTGIPESMILNSLKNRITKN
ncbi:MAG: 3-dehydroquinate synthase [Elusimicrobia bacterium RIFOXYA2_FULL_39_19]|nr:MAG: 3-dehydroquinate synthase [Elusimicrobia bacterium RIFOXYA2_FULL_39_19]